MLVYCFCVLACFTGPRSETFVASGNWVVVPADANPGQYVVVPSPSLCGDPDVLTSHGLSLKAVRALLHEWRSSPDMLFAIHPYDGSLLVWMMDGLDTVSPSFQLARLSFASRIPHAMPTADIWTLEGSIFTLAGPGPDDLEDIGKLLATPAKKPSVLSTSLSGRSTPSAWMRRRRSDGVHNSSLMHRAMAGGLSARLPSAASSVDVPHPALMLVSHHIGGAMHVWSVDFARGSAYLTPFAMRRVGSAMGHRLPCRSSLVHPSSSLLLTAAHLQEQVPKEAEESAMVMASRASELILWQMHSPSHFESDGEVLQLMSVLHSNNHAAFRQQCWIDSKLALATSELAEPVKPSGAPVVCRVGPSALFVSQNNEGALAIFQVITDAVQWLARHGGAANSAVEEVIECPKPRRRDWSTSVDSSEALGSPITDAVASLNFDMRLGSGEIISRQCGARPGCVLQLGELCDTDIIPGELVLLHSFRLNEAWLRAIKSSASAPGPVDTATEEDDQFVEGDSNKPLVAEENENFLLVALENRTGIEVSDPAHAGCNSFLHTYLVSVRRHAVVLSIDAKLEQPLLPPVVDVSCRMLAVQQLQIHGNSHVASASISSDQACAMLLDGVSMPAPWQIITVSSGGSVQCWRCIGQSADLLGTAEVNEAHLDGHTVDDGADADAVLRSLRIKWQDVSHPAFEAENVAPIAAISAASPSQLVAVHQADGESSNAVEVWDCSATGGYAWQKEGLGVSVPCPVSSTAAPVLPLWMPQHDGGNLLAVSEGSRMSIMKCHRHAPGQSRASWQNIAVTEVSNVHDVAAVTSGESPVMQSTEVPRTTNDCCLSSPTERSMLPLAWCRGNLVVGYDDGSVMLVLSHWLSPYGNAKSTHTTCLSVRTITEESALQEPAVSAVPTASAASFRAAAAAAQTQQDRSER